MNQGKPGTTPVVSRIGLVLLDTPGIGWYHPVQDGIGSVLGSFINLLVFKLFQNSVYVGSPSVSRPVLDQLDLVRTMIGTAPVYEIVNLGSILTWSSLTDSVLLAHPGGTCVLLILQFRHRSCHCCCFCLPKF